ncbi:MAG: class I SAM-dependent methyltransferase, partial [Okeania sp. SIO2B3]|nr:class I SAM-dependent methyltransferase [Okeania sp. SIO2B3]
MSIENRQNKLYSSQNHQELLENYSTWAKDYDQELVNDCNYVAPQKVAAVLSRLV